MPLELGEPALRAGRDPLAAIRPAPLAWVGEQEWLFSAGFYPCANLTLVQTVCVAIGIATLGAAWDIRCVVQGTAVFVSS
jgi:hypothetical protein